MPKMMENLEPEEKARMKRQMAMQSDPSKMLGQLWGDLTSGGGGDDSAGAAAPSTPSPSKSRQQQKIKR